MAISKSDILNGAKQCKEITVETLGDTTYIRKLTDGEVAEVTTKIASGGEIVGSKDDPEKSEIRMSGEKAIMNTRRAKHYAIAKALTNNENSDKWKPDEVSTLSSDIVDELGEKVAEYSGIIHKKTFQSWKRNE